MQNSEMRPLVLITSVINTPNKPLSYTATRSVFSIQERFEQTKKTIKTVREKIPNCTILVTECSELDDDMFRYLNDNADYFINLYGNAELENKIYGISKALGEGTMTIESLRFLIDNKMEFDSLIKISGRYWLSDNFDYNVFDNDRNVFKRIENNADNIFTALYKINKDTINKLYTFLNNNIENMMNCIGYEILFGHFTKFIDDVVLLDQIGLAGYVTVCGSFYNG